MTKRFIVYSILFSMALHCASRIGLLNQLYQERFEIAFSIGLIEELPISICSSDYDFSQKLKIETKETESSLPSSSIFQAQEIQLFCSNELVQIPSQSFSFLSELHQMQDEDIFQRYISVIEHPPTVLNKA